jgi:hypothetical protein
MAARRRTQWTREWERNLRNVERQLPAPLRRMLRQLGKNLREAQRQIEAARADRDLRWSKLSKQLRGDASRLIRQLRQAVGPTGPQARRARPARGRARRSRKK